MTQLTQEHFDQTLTGLATKADLKSLVTREDLKELREEVNDKLDAMLQLLDVRNRVAKLERDVLALKLKR